MKCEYCSKNAATFYNDENLCERHYYTFYSEDIVITQLYGVDKIEEEKILAEKYINIMNTFDFCNHSGYNKKKLKKIMKNFKLESKLIALKNPLYCNNKVSR